MVKSGFHAWHHAVSSNNISRQHFLQSVCGQAHVRECVRPVLPWPVHGALSVPSQRRSAHRPLSTDWGRDAERLLGRTVNSILVSFSCILVNWLNRLPADCWLWRCCFSVIDHVYVSTYFNYQPRGDKNALARTKVSLSAIADMFVQEEKF